MGQRKIKSIFESWWTGCKALNDNLICCLIFSVKTLIAADCWKEHQVSFIAENRKITQVADADAQSFISEVKDWCCRGFAGIGCFRPLVIVFIPIIKILSVFKHIRDVVVIILDGNRDGFFKHKIT